MSEGVGVIGGKSRWLVAVAGAALMVGVLLWLVRLPPVVALPASTPPVAVSRKSVQLANPVATADTGLKQEIELRDPRPLFLPTNFNVALPEPKLESGRTFLDNETAKLGFAEGEL